MISSSPFIRTRVLSAAYKHTYRGSAYRAVYKPFTGRNASSTTKAPKKSPLYTRTGDKGTSMLYSGERRSKRDPVFEALGNQDELNAIIGISRELCEGKENGLEDMLVDIQSRLFDVGAAIATPPQGSSANKQARTQFDSRHTEQLEKWIDILDSALPPLRNFVIPSGGLCSTHLNLARSVCRRTERSVVPLLEEGQTDPEVYRYLNRLSDFLFAAARTAAYKENKEEIIWRKAE
mmetsp:Transcript_11705/g.17734  ORF Transcript_11705/g.17734 Transcript_11705/m.17734 type:complete len:235 (+) Transcript_11705:52-756(+)